MKQVISINLQGRIIPIEQDAFELLKQYTEKLRQHFSGEEGCEEIINDIENRIVELFQQRLQGGSPCVTDADLDAVIRSIGQPEDFDDREGEEKKTNSSSNPNSDPAGKRLFRDEKQKIIGGVCSGLANYLSIDVIIVRILFVLLIGVLFIPYLVLWMAAPGSSSADLGSQRKKLYRDSENKIIAGVASGLGHYFGINPWIPRLLFLIPFFSYVWSWGPAHLPGLISIGFSPTSLLIYIILWIIVPEAKTTSEKLEMNGEKVDMQSIRKSVTDELKGAETRLHHAAKEISNKAQEVSPEIKKAIAKTGRSLGDSLSLLARIIGYFFLTIFLIVLFFILLGFGISAAVLFPLKDFLIGGATQQLLAWGTLIFFFAVPLIAFVVWIIRRLSRSKKQSKPLRFTFLGMWLLGWICLISLGLSLRKDFTYRTASEKPISIVSDSAIKGITLITGVSPNHITDNDQYEEKDINLGADDLLNTDSFRINNLSIRAEKSPNDTFSMLIRKKSFGRSPNEAEQSAGRIDPRIHIADSIFSIDPGIVITRDNKFRNQSLLVTVYIPVGKTITVKQAPGTHGVYFNGRALYFNQRAGVPEFDEEYPTIGHTYIMQEEGLFTPDGRKVEGYFH